MDIDKVQKYPATFVVKTELAVPVIKEKLREQAELQYPVRRIIERYMESIEEIINIPILSERLDDVLEQNGLDEVMDEIIRHSKVEFNFSE